jgi:uncharacterized membrane protein YraQ (UPF0718 family)
LKKITLIIGLIALLLIIVAGYRGGTQMVFQGLKYSAKTFIVILPLLLFAFGITGLLQGMLKKETIKNLLGREAGIKGIMLGAVAGAIMPGGPYVFYPIAVAFLMGGADIGSLIAFVAAKNLWTVTRIPMEVALVGWHVFIARYIVTFAFPPLMGFLGNLFFPHASENIRNWLEQRKKPLKRGRTEQ